MTAGLHARVRLDRGELRLDAALRAEPDGVVALVGPNGGGKTTLLRAVAGLEPLSEGQVVIDGAVVEDPSAGVAWAPEDRPVGLLAAQPTLFPHLSALDNVAFGLRCRGMARTDARDRAREWLDRVGAPDCARRRPAALSAGEAQRVALARALAPAPRVLLLDEPLAAVDAPSRPALRREIVSHLADFGGARVLVTHDPIEALSMATRIVVLEGGAVVQDGTAAELRLDPRSPYVAAFLGVNVFRGQALDGAVRLPHGATIVTADTGGGGGDGTTPGADAFALVRPGSVSLHRDRPAGSARNVWAATIVGLHLRDQRVRVDLEGEVDLVAEVTASAVEALGLTPGLSVWASVKATDVGVHAA